VTSAKRPSLRRRLEVGRLMVGSLVEFAIKAYGAGAAASVAISDAETLRGKADDALAAVPNLSEEYRDAQYVVEHREEIRSAIHYLNEHTPAQSELAQAADEGSETLRGIETTYSEVLQAKDSVDDFTPRPDEAFGHLKSAWEAKPDLDSIRQLAEIAEQVSPLVDEVEVLIPVYYGGFVAVADNFASDEIAATLGVMAVSLGLAFVLSQVVGFWVRRGRPGLIARTLQRWGARAFRGWYVRNLPYALSPPLYAAARERIQRDLLADPHSALDPEVIRELEVYFERKQQDASVS
jgi:hypothetical protein